MIINHQICGEIYASSTHRIGITTATLIIVQNTISPIKHPGMIKNYVKYLSELIKIIIDNQKIKVVNPIIEQIL